MGMASPLRVAADGSTVHSTSAEVLPDWDTSGLEGGTAARWSSRAGRCQKASSSSLYRSEVSSGSPPLLRLPPDEIRSVIGVAAADWPREEVEAKHWYTPWSEEERAKGMDRVPLGRRSWKRKWASTYWDLKLSQQSHLMASPPDRKPVEVPLHFRLGLSFRLAVQGHGGALRDLVLLHNGSPIMKKGILIIWKKDL